MKKRKFIGLGRKRKSSELSESNPKKGMKKHYELPDNFILGFTNQHAKNFDAEPKKKVNSEE